MHCLACILILSTVIIGFASSVKTVFADKYLRHRRQSSCNPSQFRCSNGDCISTFSVCDGTKDCSDGSDETRGVCQTNRCPAQSFVCSYGACIDKELKCDGKPDCADKSDEGSACGTENTTSTSCGSRNFQCQSGQCVDQYSRCDGLKDCSDGSDETKQLCEYFVCPLHSYRCNYGACIEKSLRCNGQADCADNSDETYNCTTGLPVSIDEHGPTTTECKLPAHPEHGAYFSTLCPPGDLRQACRNIPGTHVSHNWLLKYTCSESYDLTSSDSEYSVCDNGIWKNPLSCIKLCPPLISLSVDVRCVYRGREVPCEKPLKPGTKATAKCKQHYTQTFRPEYSSLICQENGDWTYPLFYCTPDCGVSGKSKPETLILNGTKTHQGDYPWLAALYLRNASNKWEQKCAGTLITPHIVLTAAHCLVIDYVTVAAENIKVGLGKYFRNYYKKEDGSHLVNVREVVVPRYYTGGDSYFALDIGLLDLATSIQVTAYIMPACVDWTSTVTISQGDVGHVAGWGTTENNTSSETVLSAELSYLDNASCIKQVRQAYRRFVTHDKFCATSSNGSQVDHGDSGGGMTIVRSGQHFVFGLVSTKITEQREFSLFTDLTNTEHHSWLEDHRTRLHQLHNET